MSSGTRQQSEGATRYKHQNWNKRIRGGTGYQPVLLGNLPSGMPSEFQERGNCRPSGRSSRSTGLVARRHRQVACATHFVSDRIQRGACAELRPPVLVFGVLYFFLLRSGHERVQVLLPALRAAFAMRRAPRWSANPMPGLQASHRDSALAQPAGASELRPGIRQDVGHFYPASAEAQRRASRSITFTVRLPDLEHHSLVFSLVVAHATDRDAHGATDRAI